MNGLVWCEVLFSVYYFDCYVFAVAGEEGRSKLTLMFNNIIIYIIIAWCISSLKGFRIEYEFREGNEKGYF